VHLCDRTVDELAENIPQKTAMHGGFFYACRFHLQAKSANME
jgi:hypothetical protein